MCFWSLSCYLCGYRFVIPFNKYGFKRLKNTECLVNACKIALNIFERKKDNDNKSRDQSNDITVSRNYTSIKTRA